MSGLTDSDAGISSVRRWSAYGKLLSGSAEPIGYFWTGNTGSRVYQSLGLNDNRARHYGRNIKQWITRDPLWPSELPYAYVGGNPVTTIDPSGRFGQYPWSAPTSSAHSNCQSKCQSFAEFISKLPPGQVVVPSRDCTGKQFGPDANGRPSLPPGADYIRNCCCARQQLGYASLDWFYKNIRSGARWDFKVKDPCYEVAGNYHYGWMAACLGLSLEDVLIAAGLYQIYSGTSRPEWQKWCLNISWWEHDQEIRITPELQPPYGDDPRDQEEIKKGYRDAVQNSREITRKCKLPSYQNPCREKPKGK